LGRSKYDYIAQAARAQDSPRLTVSALDVYKIEDNDTIDFYSDVGNDFIAAYANIDAAANQWNLAARKILERIAAPADTSFSFTFQKKEAPASEALRTAKQYRIGIVPGEAATAWPKMELQLGKNGYYGTVALAKGWEDKANADALRLFMTALAQEAEKSKTARRETDMDFSGTYRLERSEAGDFNVYRDGPAPAPAADTAKTGAQTLPMRSAVTQFKVSAGVDPQQTVLTWSRLNYMEQLMDAKSAQLSVSVKDVYEAASGNGLNVVSFYKGAAEEFIANYNKAREVSDKWNLMVARITNDVGSDQKGFITTGSFYHLGITPAAPGATGTEMKVTANRNGVFYASMSLPVTWDDKTSADALRAFMTRLQKDTEAAKVAAGTYRFTPGTAQVSFEAAPKPALPAPKL
jgi:hypothetical protein